MTMIANSLHLVLNRFNDYLKAKYPVNNQKKAVLSNLINQDGSVATKQDQVVVSVVNVEHETVISTYNRYVSTGDSKVGVVSSPVYINLYILVTCYFEGSNYTEGLKYLSYVIGFFQINPVFNQQSLPGLDSSIDKLAFEMCSLDASQLSHLISMTGAKYLPSVLYKVRMFTFQDYAIQSEVSVVSKGDNPVGVGL
jgi:hypothetical protein